ncbi:cupin domain-containing protein [Herbiconiux sp.]|uniref:cupin domain-containing protein n=1 Tax=Herbiconiux sp. TaxID=1871186 RepID=UPI0025B83480|nr:cupin domain-containing protein [Herbiconiux sp.]
MSIGSRHVRSLRDAPAQHSSELGSIQRLTKEFFPLLNRISIKRLVLEPGTIREPHWHANADELTYCLSGSVIVSTLDDADVFATFTVSAGEMFHVLSGAVHHIENVGDSTAELIVVFSHESPEDFSLHAAFGAMSDAVLGNTYDLPASAFAAVPRDTSPADLVRGAGDAEIPLAARYPDPHRFDVEGQNPPLSYEYGSARLARQQFWPALRHLSMYSLRIADDGMREPHWHPETAELGYVHQGAARMSVLDPDGSVDTYVLGPGDVYFIPRAYPHQIEVVGDEDIHFLVFFDQPTPGDIGYRATASAFSRRVLAATFGVDDATLPVFPVTPVDPLMVRRSNPVDPVDPAVPPGAVDSSA